LYGTPGVGKVVTSVRLQWAGCVVWAVETGNSSRLLVVLDNITCKTLKNNTSMDVRFQVLTAASMMFRAVFWVILPCRMIVDRRFRGA
jgi:hypothetical protein